MLTDLKFEQDAAVVEVLATRLDASVAVAFKEEVLKIINGGNHRLVLDLSRVQFVDSSGLGALVSMLKALGPRGALAISGAQANVLGLLKLTRMDKVFTLTPSLSEAVARLAG